MALVGNITVGLSVVTGKFTKGLDKAKSAISDFAGSATGALAGLATVGTVIAGLKKSFDTLDELGAQANKIGVGVEALQELQFAAGQSDVAIETLQNGLQKMVVQLGNNSKAFEELGLSAGMLRQMGATDAFGAIAEQIASIQDPAEQSAQAVKIFGKAGAELLPLLKEGSAGIKEFAQAARDRGLIMSDEEVQTVKEANDALGACAASVEMLFNRAAVAIAPVMAKTADFFSMSIQGWNLIARDISGLFGDLESNADPFPTVELTDHQKELHKIWEETTAQNKLVAEMQIEADKLTEKWRQQSETVGMTTREAEIYKLQLAGATDEQINQLKAAAQLLDQQKAAADWAAEQAKRSSEETKKMNDDIDRIKEFKKEIQFEIKTFGMSEQEKALERFNQSLNEKLRPEETREIQKLQDALSLKESLAEMRKTGEELAASLKTPAEIFHESMQELEVLKNSGFIDQTTFDRASEKARNEFAQTIPEIKLAGVATAGSSEAFSTLARARSLGTNDPMQNLNKTNEQQLEVQKEIARNTRIRTTETVDSLAA